MNEVAKKSADELTTRQKLLEGEIQANEDENQVLQAELDQIYAEQNRRRD